MRPAKIRVVSICLFSHAGHILVFKAFDSVKGTPFYRPLGGGVEPGETTQAAIVREIREEIGRDVANLRLLGTLENIFMHEGNAGHEIVFVYDGSFVDVTLYNCSYLTVQEDSGKVLTARWRRLDSFDDYHRLVPEELYGLVKRHVSTT
jgi:8-oxo-dGTP pyrophosphatase MutT (NUDIX family)